MQIFSCDNSIDVKTNLIGSDDNQNIAIILYNYSDEDIVINVNDRIAKYTYVKISREITSVETK